MTQPTATVREGGRERNLERDAVVRAALELLDEAGYAGLTLRRLADRLHVKAAALYWHFENKQDLIDAMAVATLQQEFDATAARSPLSREWRELLSQVAHTHRAALMRHRDGAQLMAHANLRQSSMLKGMELLLQTLQGQGFGPDLAVDSIFTIIRYTLGCVFEEQADPHTREHPASHHKSWHDMAHVYPLLAKTLNHSHTRHSRPGHMFQQGLALILDGIERRLAL